MLSCFESFFSEVSYERSDSISSAGLNRCRAAEEFLRRKGIHYISKDIRADPKAMDELVNKWHSRSTATVVIDGEAIIGFNHNRDRIDKLLSQQT